MCVCFHSLLSSEVDSALFTTLLPLGDQLISEMHPHQKLLPVFIDYFHCLVLLAGKGNNCGHLSLVTVIESWFPECLARLEKETDVSLLRKPQVSKPVSAMLGYMGDLYSAVLLGTDMARYSEKRRFAEEEDSPLLVSGVTHFVCVCVCVCVCVMVVLLGRNLILRRRRMEVSLAKMTNNHNRKKSL